MLDKFTIAAALREMGTLMRFRGDNAFKVRAYEAGAAAIEGTGEDLGALVDEGRLVEVPGIGAALAARITELYRTGRSAALEELRRSAPAGVPDLLRVPELGPKKIAALHAALGIQSVADLKAACLDGRVRAVKGFGEKTERKILDGIARFEARDDRMPLADGLELAARLLAHLRAEPAVRRAELAGSLRRCAETVGDVNLVAEAEAGAAAAVLDRLARFPAAAAVLARGADRCRVRLGDGAEVDLQVAAPGRYAAALLARTGSAGHVARLGALGAARGVRLDEGGSEEELYGRLGLPLIPPELREDAGEIEAALAGALPADLVTAADVQGAVHCHTVYSDGRNTIEEMARAAEALGLRYLTITDHSQSAFYAGGVKLDQLKAQWDEIARVQERTSVRLLRGAEVDILGDGALDYPDAILEQLDVIIASIHSRMKMDEDQMTRRLVAAMRQPVFKIWGHALGRLIGRRPPFACRVEEVLDAVAASRAAIEVNGDPSRLDLEPRWIREARRRGIRFVISTDAHSTAGLRNLSFGVATARRGWLRRGEVLNTLAPEAFQAAVRPAG